MNYLIAKVGNQNFLEAKEVKIDKGFVMSAQVVKNQHEQLVVKLQHHYDVGLLFPNPKYIQLMTEPTIKPIKLANDKIIVNSKTFTFNILINFKLIIYLKEDLAKI